MLLTLPIQGQAAALQDDEFDLFNVEGYRLYRYRSPTPPHSEHATTLTTAALQTLLAGTPKPVLLDVQPLTWNHVFIETEPRQHLPGSTWLPNVGVGELDSDWADYYRAHLIRLTGNNLDYPVVIYCRADCWMSWNALKRAASWGYSNLYWYRNGTDGWAEHDLATVRAKPEPFPLQLHLPPQ